MEFFVLCLEAALITNKWRYSYGPFLKTPIIYCWAAYYQVRVTWKRYTAWIRNLKQDILVLRRQSTMSCGNEPLCLMNDWTCESVILSTRFVTIPSWNETFCKGKTPIWVGRKRITLFQRSNVVWDFFVHKSMKLHSTERIRLFTSCFSPAGFTISRGYWTGMPGHFMLWPPSWTDWHTWPRCHVGIDPMPDKMNLDYLKPLYFEFQKYKVITMSVAGGQSKRHANPSYKAKKYIERTFLISDYH